MTKKKLSDLEKARRRVIANERWQLRELRRSRSAKTSEMRQLAKAEFSLAKSAGEEVERNLEKAWRQQQEKSRLEWAEKLKMIRKIYLGYDPELIKKKVKQSV